MRAPAKLTLPTLALAAALLPLAAGPAAAAVKTGTLVCNVAPGVGLLIVSRKSLDCHFRPVRGKVEHYTGSIGKIGIDIGVTSGGTIVWAVYEPTAHKHHLGGTYAGATAEATIAAGLGANVLVGGDSRSIALQPLSVSGQTGLNIAAGIGVITLTPVR